MLTDDKYYDYAVLSKAVYNDFDSEVLTSAERNFLKTNYIATDLSNHMENLGVRSFLYTSKNEETDENVVVFAGSDDIWDFISDSEIPKYGMATSQFIDVYNLYQEITHAHNSKIKVLKRSLDIPYKRPYMERFISLNNGQEEKFSEYIYMEERDNPYQGRIIDSDKIVFAGHSLGGHLAGLMSMVTGNVSVIFNAPSFFSHVLDRPFYYGLNSDGSDAPFVQAFSDVDAIINRLIGCNYSTDQINHLYNDVFWEVISGFGNNWSSNISVNGLDRRAVLSSHQISKICDTLYARKVLDDMINVKCFLGNENVVKSDTAVDFCYHFFCLKENEIYETLDYGDSEKIQNVLTMLGEWKLKYNGGKIKIDLGGELFNGTSGGDLVYLGTSDMFVTDVNDGDDIVYSGDFINKEETNYRHDVVLGSGNDVYYGLSGEDQVYTTGDNTENDINKVFLGGGSDFFRGGDGVDIVDGGTGLTEDFDKSYQNLMTDKKEVSNIIDLGNGDNIFYGGCGYDDVQAGNGNDYLNLGAGDNRAYGGLGDDVIISDLGDDYLEGSMGCDYLSPGRGINRIECGLDGDSDLVVINNNSQGEDTIYNLRGKDIISCAGGFDLHSIIQEGENIVIKGMRGNKIIMYDKHFPKNLQFDIPMPVLYFPNGDVYQWKLGRYAEDGVSWIEGEYVKSELQWPAYEEVPSEHVWHELKKG